MIEPGFHEAFHGIPANYQMSVHKLSAAEAASAVASVGDEEISEERRIRLFSYFEEQGVDFIKSDLQNGGHRIVGGPPSTRKLAREWVRMKEAERAEAERAKHTIHVSGPNSRVNINSSDHSTNTVVGDSIFREIYKALDESVHNDAARAHLKMLVSAMESAPNKQSFTASYQAFIASAADHITVLTPFLPALTNLLGSFTP